MKKTLSLLVLHFSFLLSFSQNLPCGGGRFMSRVFTATTKDPAILFGHNKTFNNVEQDLFMDIYQPAGDLATVRPLIILAFGGAFLTGDRTQLGPLCDSLAGKGYVTAAIDYRKYDNPAGVFGFYLNPNDAVDATAKAMSDMKAAIRYFKRDASTLKTYRIDTNSIIIGGISSGSIAALHTAYINTPDEAGPPVSTYMLSNGGFEGNTDLPASPLIGTYTFAGIKGVWNMSGALFDSGYIKTGDAALFGIHGTADNTVPYGYGQIVPGKFVSGSSSLYHQALKVGVPTAFISVQGGGHTDFYDSAEIIREIDTVASKFFGNILCPSVLAVSGASLEGNITGGNVKLSWQTFNENDSKGFEVEKLLPSGWTSLGFTGSKSVNGQSSAPLHYTFDDEHPQKGSNLYRLKIISLNSDVAYSKTIRIVWEGKAGNMFVIYPNPAGASLQYKTSLPLTGLNTLKIYSSNMQLLQSHKYSGMQSVPLAGLPGGLYFAVIYNSVKGDTAGSWFIKR